MRFSIGNVLARATGDVAWVTCTENILSDTRGKLTVTTLLATNIFERRAGDWLMVHHHASHVLTPEPPPAG
jgi:ketosteroid isomerase-like protein